MSVTLENVTRTVDGIAHIRDELRAYDRKYESNQIKLR